MPTIEDIARASKDNLRSSLLVTHNLTLGSTAPCDALLQRMNDVLRDVVDSNYDCNLNSVGALYAAIGDKQPHMMDNSSNLALVNFSRTFAVVLEDTIRRAGGGGRDGNNNNNEWRSNNNNNNNNGGGGGQDSWQLPVAGSGAPVAYGRPPSVMSPQGGGWAGATATATASNALKGFGPSQQQQQHAMTAAAASSVKFCGFGGGLAASGAADTKAADALARAARAERESQKDYSVEAIMGRIAVFKVPTGVEEKQLREYLAQVGPIDSISYPYGVGGKHKGFALVKYLDNETADAAVAQLHGKKLDGAELVIERAKYWFKKDDKKATQRGRVAVEQPIRKQSEEESNVNAPESASVNSSASDDDDDDSDDFSDEVDSRDGESDADVE